MIPSCLVCGSERWANLVEPHPQRSVRTDGVAEEQPLRKLHCRECGLGYRRPTLDLPKVYSEDYALYRNRPGAEAFNQARHPILVDLLAEFTGSDGPARVLEVGCGNGSTLTAVRHKWPHATTVGLEPSRDAACMARSAGHRVVEGLVGASLPEEVTGQFDIIYSNHVIEHTADPVQFLEVLADRLIRGGLLVTICPNGAVPHAELIHSDHLFSFTTDHLATVSRKAHLAPLGAREFVLEEAHEYNHLLVAGSPKGQKSFLSTQVTEGRWPDASSLESARNVYLGAWAGVEAALSARMGAASTVMCFGTGGWAARLAGYAPNVWERVSACTVDGPQASRFCQKPVLDYAMLRQHRPDAVIVGANPSRQEALAARLQRDGFRAIRWNDLIDR